MRIRNLLGIAVVASAAFCQTKPSGPTTPTPTIPTPGKTTTPNSIPQPGTTPGVEARPVFLSGKVMLSDGVAPPDSVPIERVCGSRIFREAFTDSKGRFSFEVGRNVGM